jgi:hypothetical protein
MPGLTLTLSHLIRLARREWVTVLILGVIAAAAVAMVAFSLTRPEPLSFTPTNRAVLVDAATGRKRLTIDATHENSWRFVSLRADSALERPDRLDWDLAIRRFHIATNGGTGFAGQGAAGVDSLVATSTDTTRSGFGKWYDYGFTSHLLTPKPVTYRVRAADGMLYTMRILSYYCPRAQPGCLTFEYQALNGE